MEGTVDPDKYNRYDNNQNHYRFLWITTAPDNKFIARTCTIGKPRGRSWGIFFYCSHFATSIPGRLNDGNMEGYLWFLYPATISFPASSAVICLIPQTSV